uniref:Uncharacterized protein n=1 Tax=Aegilops tauschii subsp. strangulata TaxID=200361 RepID=A0A453Q6T6_AEGTS
TGGFSRSTPRIDPRRGRRKQRLATRSGCGCSSSPLTTSAVRNFGQNLLPPLPGNESHKFYSDEHYLPTLFNMVDPTGVANWSVTRVDCSEGK